MQNVLPKAAFIGNDLVFADRDGFDRACQHGAFYLAHPRKMDFAPGVMLAQNYYLAPDGGPLDDYRGYKTRDLVGSALGYSHTGADQDELLQLECALWREHLPSAVAQLLWSMNELSKQTLTQLFFLAGVRAEHTDIVAAGVLADQALQYCIFNHFRPSIIGAVGLTPHKDSGFITMLYTTEPGLESLEGDQWVAFDPIDAHFTVVLGHAFEILTARSARSVSASYHRVRTTQAGRADRFTFGTYIGPHWDQDLYQYAPDGALVRIESFFEFQQRKAAQMGYEFHPKVTRALD